MTKAKQKIERVFRGTVVSDRMDKTIVVRVTRRVWHPKYHRQYTVSAQYPVHDEQNAHHVGDVVEFVETRPLSKRKRWAVRKNEKLRMKDE